MAAKITELRSRAIETARHPRTRKIAIWLVAIVAAFGIIAGLVAPPLLRGKLASELSTKLHRQVSIEQIRINPFAMSVTVRGFLMKERQGSATAFSFDELYANLELASLFRWGPVLKEIRLVKPYVNVVRNEDRTYNFTDLIDEFTKGPPGPKGPPAPTPRFALNNIQVLDGKIDFDDRPEQTKHAITSIKIGVPFISSIPSQVEIKVQPAFYALVNGAPFQIDGETKPFKESRDSTIHLDIDKLQIPKYVEYSPVDLNFKSNASITYCYWLKRPCAGESSRRSRWASRCTMPTVPATASWTPATAGNRIESSPPITAGTSPPAATSAVFARTAARVATRS